MSEETMGPPARAEEAPSGGRIADALVLCMTRGMSLCQWGLSGSLEREWALYERLGKHYGRIVVVSSASEAGERGVAQGLGAEVVFNERGTRAEDSSRGLPEVVTARLVALGVRSCVVKTNQFEGGAEAVAITRALRANKVDTALIARGGFLWSQFEAWKHGADSEQAARAAAEEGDLCRNADLVIGTTESMVGALSWRYGVERCRCEIVPNYVLVDEPTPEPGLPAGDKPVILAAGRLEAQKRFDRLIHAVALSGLREGVTLRIIGKGPLDHDLRKQAQRERVELDLVQAMPHPRLLAHMRACALFVQCSAFEGHPKTVLEAMAAGACVLVTDTPGLGEVVRDGDTGRVVTDSEERLAEAIAELMGDEDRRRSLGGTAKGVARSRFGLDRVAELERNAHASAFAHARVVGRARRAIGAVRWDPLLLPAPVSEQVEAWRASLHGFARRLPPKDRARFLLGLDDPVYRLQGPAAIEAETEPGGSGLHPKHRLMRYHDFFVERVNAGERVVDLGSGVGALAASIAERAGAGRGATVVGVEIEPANVARAQAIARERGLTDRLWYAVGDITTHRAQPTPPGVGFDVVVLSNVLEHIKDRPAMLRRWTAWYAPSRFLIRVPAFDRDWKTPYKKELGLEWRLDETHEIEYTEESLRRELEEGGLEITQWVARWGEYWVSARPVPAPGVWAGVRMLVFDFDGVMSNNQVLVMQDGAEGVLCNRSDGLGIETLRRASAGCPEGTPTLSMLVLSKEVNPVVAARCRKLKLECHQGVDDKLPALQQLAADRGVAREHIAYVGNDVNDVSCMNWVGLPIAVADAYPECRAAARFVTRAAGGQGAVREVCERVLRARRAADGPA